MSVLYEDLDTINNRLKEKYGETNNQPNFRVVWSESQYEWRRGVYRDYTREGIFLREVEEVRNVPKYRQWISECHVLEILTPVPAINQKDLPDGKLTYEPFYPFKAHSGKAIKPSWTAVSFLIESRFERMRTAGFTNYRDPESTPEMALEDREKRLKELEEALFGNETDVTDALAQQRGVTVPHNFERIH